MPPDRVTRTSISSSNHGCFVQFYDGTYQHAVASLLEMRKAIEVRFSSLTRKYGYSLTISDSINRFCDERCDPYDPEGIIHVKLSENAVHLENDHPGVAQRVHDFLTKRNVPHLYEKDKSVSLAIHLVQELERALKVSGHPSPPARPPTRSSLDVSN